MAAGIGARGTFQWGKESTSGTAVAATERALFEGFEITPTDEVSRPQMARGYTSRNQGDGHVFKRGVDWTATGPFLFDQFHTICSMSVEGGVSATGSGSERDWSFDRTPTGVATPDTYTIERRLSDGSNNLDLEWAYSFAREWSVAIPDEGDVTVEVQGSSRRAQTSSLTSLTGVDDQPSVDVAVAPRCRFYMQDSATFDSNQITGEVLSGSLRFISGFFPLMTCDNRSDLDFTTVGFNPREAGLEASLTVILDPSDASAGQLALEKARAEAATVRYVRMEIVGADSRIATFDFLATHEPGSIQAVGEESGQQIVEYSLVDAQDGTNNWFSVDITNKRSAFADGTAAT